MDRGESRFPDQDSTCKTCGQSVDAPCAYIDSDADWLYGFYHHDCWLAESNAADDDELPDHEFWACSSGQGEAVDEVSALPAAGAAGL